ncbi:hypothetical protein ACI0ZN_002744, partial [Cronobacter turicensis]
NDISKIDAWYSEGQKIGSRVGCCSYPHTYNVVIKSWHGLKFMPSVWRAKLLGNLLNTLGNYQEKASRYNKS